MPPIPARWGPRLLSLLRMVGTFLYMAHGTQKLFVWPTSEPGHAVALVSLMGLAGVIEVFGGLLLFLGLFTRPVAFVLAGEMAVAYFMAHAPAGPWPVQNKGEAAVLYCFFFLFVAARGAGAWSLDAMRSHRGPAHGLAI
jgi:putative oxidoreductase